MTTRKPLTERHRQRTVTLPPEIDDFLDLLPDGQKSAWLVDAAREKMELERLFNEYRPDGTKKSDWVIKICREWIANASNKAAVAKAKEYA